jgi:ABC-type transport system involved in multi-copper enzyme maturation permease subunit
MVNLATTLLGPLVGPECRRALARGWLLVVRALVGGAVALVVVTALWWWWISQLINNFYQPYYALRTALSIVETAAVVLALIMGPALLGGSLAGERERGALGLLLTTRVSSLEIVLGRLVGKLTQVGMVLLGFVPAVILLAALSGFGFASQAVLLVLPVAVAFGGAGLAVAASSVAKRGRDALLGVYVGILFFLLGPLLVELLATPSLGLARVPAWLDMMLYGLNPFVGIYPVTWRDSASSALATIAIWLIFGVAGSALAASRLRPSHLGPKDDVGRKRSQRRWRVPPMLERPMLWKELYIDRAGSLGRFGRVLAWIFILLVGGSGIGFGATYVVAAWIAPNPAWETWAASNLAVWFGSGWAYMALFTLIQLAIGLRASVGVSSERERGTWDALMTSPLDGREIVIAKLRGSLSALSGLLAATLVAWSAGALSGAIDVETYIERLVGLFVVGVFMAALGVRVSLEASTATRAMALTIMLGLAACVSVCVAAALIFGSVFVLWMSFQLFLGRVGLAGVPPFPPISASVAWAILFNGIYLLVELLLISDTRLRFDRIAGRMTEGNTSIAFERMVYGEPNAPVFLDADGRVATGAPPVGRAVKESAQNAAALSELG